MREKINFSFVVLFTLRSVSTCLISINLPIVCDTCKPVPVNLLTSLFLNVWARYANSGMFPTSFPQSQVVKLHWQVLYCWEPESLHNKDFSWSFLLSGECYGRLHITAILISSYHSFCILFFLFTQNCKMWSSNWFLPPSGNCLLISHAATFKT